MEGEAGIFIYDEEWLNSTVPSRGHPSLYDFRLGGSAWLIAHIMKDNKRAIKYNKIIGYKLEEDREEIVNPLTLWPLMITWEKDWNITNI